jgi:hypothetical protein
MDAGFGHARAPLLHDAMQPFINLAQLFDFLFAQVSQRAGRFLFAWHNVTIGLGN